MTEKMAQELAAEYMMKTAHPRQPKCLTLRPWQQIGQTYVGKNLRIKQKCTMCECIYAFEVAKSGNDPPQIIEMTKSAERTRPMKSKRGCCSEALVSVRGCRILRILGQLQDGQKQRRYGRRS